MIGSLRGTLAEKIADNDSGAECVIDVGGVGYRVLVGGRCARSLGPVGSPAALAIHTHVREGAITLYGFSAAAERRAFELLISAHGVGPALALAILGTYAPSELALAVATEDVDALMLVPGVGRKTAARLVIDIGQRADELTGLPITAASAPRRPLVPATHAEVGEALVALGYTPDEVKGALAALGEDGTTEELLRLALRELAPSR